MDLSVRSDLPELMDADDLPLADYNQCLTDLAAVNRVTLTHRATIDFLEMATKTWAAGAEISVLDVACGQGDLLRAISRWATKRGFVATLTGVDLNPRSAVAAQSATLPSQNITYFTGDVFAFTPATQPDFIVTSQFTHHLADADIIRLLTWMQATAWCGWHIADLHRHFIPYYGFRVLCRLFGWHKIVRYDGTISIARSFTRADWERYLAAANIKAKIRWHMLFRYGVSRLQ
ncbi:MAG: methyltransferase domain-containing protein [Acidocella sp.]|nr:methyltransferase domain-containing protein [Acidocella sp.]